MCVYYMSMFIVHNCARCTHIVNVVGKGIGMCGTMRNILCVKVREENKAQSLTRFLADSSLVYRSFYMFAIKMCVPMLRCQSWDSNGQVTCCLQAFTTEPFCQTVPRMRRYTLLYQTLTHSENYAYTGVRNPL